MSELDKKMKIVIADDSQNMLRTLANMLRIMGFDDVVRAVDGENALQKIRLHNPDLVLCDWNMPKMKGVEVLKALREDDMLKNIPFLMITGEVDRQIVAEAAEVSVDGYLLKPFTQEDLRLKIEEILEKKKTPSPIDIHLSVAKVYLEAKQFDKAADEIRKALKINARSPRINYFLGALKESQGDLENAEALYQRSVEFGHQFIKGHEALARVLTQKGDIAGASQHLKQAVKISPRNIERQIQLSQALVKIGNTEDAQKVLNNVMTMADKNRAEIAMQVGETFLAAGMAADAQKAFAEGLSSDPKAIHLYNRLGMALRRQKKFKEAVDNYRMAIRLDPENEGLYYNLGRAYYENKDKDMAMAAMRKALKLFPDFVEAQEFLDKLKAVESDSSTGNEGGAEA